jgi:hypothetical protein
LLRARAQALAGAALMLVAALMIGSGAVRPAAGVGAAPHATVVGRVMVAHMDALRATGSRMVPVIDTAKGPVALRLPQGLPVAPGTRVSIRAPRYDRGAIVGGAIAKLGPPTVVENDGQAGPANFRPGPRTTLVLLAQVGSQPAPGSADAIRNIIFTAPNSADAFIQEESFGQLSLTGKLRSDGDVYGPYAVGANASVTGCDAVNWGTQAEQSFQAATKLNPETWDEVIVVFQYPYSSCAFTGEAEIGDITPTGGARHAWINAVLTNGVPTTSVIAHELGHNLGVDHAGGLECTDATTQARVAFNDMCVANMAAQLPNQYLDPFDVMGTGSHEESAYHRWESGWLPSSSVQTVTSSGTYLLAPEEAASSAVQLLEVPRAAGGLPSYWLDFRQPFGSWFDTFSPFDPVVNGVSIRYANSSKMEHPSKSWLIDTTPNTPTFDDAPLSVGSTYTDAEQGVSITTLAVSPLGALVHITVANGDDTTPPSAVTGLSATRVATGVQLSWTAANDDSGTVQHYLVRRNGLQLADVYATSTIDTAPLPGRTSEYDVYPVDPAGNVGPASAINVTISDVTPPSAPPGLVATVVGSSVRLSWSPAIDDAGVTSYEVDRDGAPLAAGLVATSFTDPSAGPGTHVYAVRAFDAAGNAGAYTTVTITEVAAAAAPPKVVVKLKTLTALKLKRLGKHRVLVSWKAQKGVHRYEVLRGGGKKPVMLATVKKTQYTDGRAPVGKLTMKRYVVRAVLPS